MKLIFATSNQHKVREILSMTCSGIEIVSLKDIGFTEEIPETRDTIEGNSLQKAEYLANKLHLPCFSEDTGLEINALNGEPGVYSARYAGPKANFSDNISKVLDKMRGVKDRTARFKTVITYFDGSKYVQFEGITDGTILEEVRGIDGFGYDPIFQPLGYDKAYAEMTLEEKNQSSHRRKSFEQFANHLKDSAVL